MPRPYCRGCRLPLNACLCAAIRRQPCPLPVVVLQHPSEARNAKSTVPLLQLGLSGLRVEVAETMAPPLGNWWLLYPGGDAVDLDGGEPGPGVPIDGLIVLDGTWRKTRRLLYLNPWLPDLPRLSFSQAPASRYAIRKGPGGQALSTLESLAHVLHRLSCHFDPRPLYRLLDTRVALFQAHQPRRTGKDSLDQLHHQE
ncbi:tRNA-uridine aminocarboxypropyltransferase [Zobellella sp. DQSA1]|uniref:tRNA-uridine aminocarboxypropyltransferase n=1 Tax=Zobellella sp. DQSA1 TaxID=3342386 RepID=UPI0035C21CB2